MNETDVKTKTRKPRRFPALITIIAAFCMLGSTARAFAGDADNMDWLIPWNIDGCWRLILISMPVVIIIGYISQSWKVGIVVACMLWALAIFETLFDLGFGFYIRKPELIELVVKIAFALCCALVGALSGYAGGLKDEDED